jgi:hypothetical protein
MLYLSHVLNIHLGNIHLGDLPLIYLVNLSSIGKYSRYLEGLSHKIPNTLMQCSHETK